MWETSAMGYWVSRWQMGDPVESFTGNPINYVVSGCDVVCNQTSIIGIIGEGTIDPYLRTYVSRSLLSR